MVADVANSVGLIAREEWIGVDATRQLLARAANEVLPRHHGKLLERIGDAIQVEFDGARAAIACAAELHRLAAQVRTISAAKELAFRISIHSGDLLTDEQALYGDGLNVVYRMNADALAGETLLSSNSRDQLGDGVDGDFEDLGERHFKGREDREPVRVYRVAPIEPPQAVAPRSLDPDLGRPAIAVIPLACRGAAEGGNVVGELFADRLIAELSKVRSLRVISRLSTSIFADRPHDPRYLKKHLHADYCVSGSYVESSAGLLLMIELMRTSSGDVLWCESISAAKDDLLRPERDLLSTIATEISEKVGEDMYSRALYAPLPTLDGCALLFWAITLATRTHLANIDRPRQMLEYLIQNHRNVAAPRVWLAHWHVMRLVQGVRPISNDDRDQALQLIKRALDVEPENAQALATLGFVQCHMFKDFDAAKEHLERARETDPHCPWAWIYLGALEAFVGDGPAAEAACEEARACSPVDPAGHFFDTIAASAAFTNERYERALEMASRSRRGDRYHASTVRVQAMSLALLGRHEEAAECAIELKRIEPNLTVRGYLARTPSAAYDVGQRCAEALRLLGIPES